MAWQFLTPVMYSQEMVEEALPAGHVKNLEHDIR